MVPLTLADQLALQGPSGTPYEGGTFQLSFNIPEQYPLTSPQVKFVTKVRHALDWVLSVCHACALTRAAATPRLCTAGLPSQRPLEDGRDMSRHLEERVVTRLDAAECV